MHDWSHQDLAERDRSIEPSRETPCPAMCFSRRANRCARSSCRRRKNRLHSRARRPSFQMEAIMKNVAVLGSGPVGQVLADGFLEHGYDVMRGSREPQKLQEWKSKAGAKASAGTFTEAARCGDMVVLGVKGSAAESA